MDNFLSWRFWGPVILSSVFILAGVWKMLLAWSGSRSGPKLRGWKRRTFWIIFALSIAAWILFLYWISLVTGKFPWY
jgi:hypothetical protein